jgi:hypothetical protein
MSAFDNITFPTAETPEVETPSADPTTEAVATPSPDATTATQDQADTVPQQPSPAVDKTAGVEGDAVAEPAEGREDYIDPKLPPDIRGRLAKTAEYQREAKAYEPIKPLVEQHGLSVVKTGVEMASLYLDPQGQIDQLATRMAEVSPSRFTELRNHIYGGILSGFPDTVLAHVLGVEGVTVESVKRVLEAGQTAEPQTDEDLDDELSLLSPALKREIEELRAMKGELPDIKQELSSFREERLTEQQQKESKEVETIKSDLFDSVMSVVEERKKELGLEEKPTDPPKVKTLKRQLTRLLEGDLIPTFDRVEENKRILEKVNTFADKRERHNAFAFEDQLKVRVANAFNEVAQSEDARNLFDALKAELLSQSTPKNPNARNELVAGQPAPLTPTDPFVDARGKGVSSIWDAAVASARPAGVTQ